MVESFYFAGYAGWEPGQLRAEISRGDWYTVKADDKTIFEAEPGRVWRELIAKLAGRELAPPPPTMPAFAPQGIRPDGPAPTGIRPDVAPAGIRPEHAAVAGVRPERDLVRGTRARLPLAVAAGAVVVGGVGASMLLVAGTRPEEIPPPAAPEQAAEGDASSSGRAAGSG